MNPLLNHPDLPFTGSQRHALWALCGQSVHGLLHDAALPSEFQHWRRRPENTAWLQAQKEDAPTAATVEASNESTLNKGNSVMNNTVNTLIFQEHHLDITDIHGKPWLRGVQIALSLGYSNPKDAIQDLYNRNADEFDSTMTQIIELDTNGGKQSTRIFSLRGCHLLGMLARTETAKAFRRWVLDVLQQYTAAAKAKAAAKISKEQREALSAEVHRLSQRPGEPQQAVYARLFAEFEVRSSHQIGADGFQAAFDFLQDPPAPPRWLPQLLEDDVLYLQGFPEDTVLHNIAFKNRHLINGRRLMSAQPSLLPQGV